MNFWAIGIFLLAAANLRAEYDCLYQLESRTLAGEPTLLADYEGKVILLVNVASRCGFAQQYTGLEKIFTQFKDRGFVVLAFPSNDFGGQEPGTPQEIAHFCAVNYHVTFPIFEKVHIKGSNKNPVYSFLCEKFPEPTWNFCKYLINRQGRVVHFYDSNSLPDSPELIEAIEIELEKKTPEDATDPVPKPSP